MMNEKLEQFFRPWIRVSVKKNKWALLWLAIVAVACLSVWRVGGDRAFQAKNKAARVAELSISAQDTQGELSALMTREAFSVMQKERSVSGFDQALASSDSKINARAWAVEQESEGAGWVVRGFASASVERKEPSAQEAQWSGAWIASIENKEGSLRVTRFKIASVPSGASLNETSKLALKW